MKSKRTGYIWFRWHLNVFTITLDQFNFLWGLCLGLVNRIYSMYSIKIMSIESLSITWKPSVCMCAQKHWCLYLFFGWYYLTPSNSSWSHSFDCWVMTCLLFCQQSVCFLLHWVLSAKWVHTLKLLQATGIRYIMANIFNYLFKKKLYNKYTINSGVILFKVFLHCPSK